MESEAYHEMSRLEEHHWWYRGMRDITDVLLQSLFHDRHNLKILDAGCGTGRNMTALKRFGAVIGLDFSSLALNYAQRSHSGSIVQASIENLPYAADTFDLVTSFDVIYSAGVRDDVTAIRELTRVTHPNGYVVMRVPALRALRGEHDTFVHGIRRYTARELQAKFRAGGLTPVRFTYANSFLLPVIFLARKLQHHSVHGRSDVQVNPGGVADLLYHLLRIESWWIKQGGHFAAGVSLFGIGQKLAVSYPSDAHVE
jgi:SAM-dependent methyltransferase